MQPMVQLSVGPLRGSLSGGVERYLGIPFAASPDGAWRLQPPQPVPGWDGVLDATRFGPAAPQPSDVPREAMFDLPAHEWAEVGCLTLNIWAPRSGAALLPVLVWIHGGGFFLGSGSDPSHDGARLAHGHDVIVVTINYRLGALGYLGAEGVPANLGLQDQVAALRWVREHIGSFGGDSGNVTVFGQSAGAMSAVCLLVSPPARGLFHRAIVQSGSAEMVLTQDEARARAAEFGGMLGVDSADTEGLRTLDISDLLRAQSAFDLEMEQRGELVAFGPVIDGEWLPDQPLRILEEGGGHRMPVILGNTRHEGRMFTELVPGQPVGADMVEAMLAEAFVDPGAARAAYRANEDWKGETDLFAALLGDELFGLPTDRLACALSSNGWPTWRYRFDWRSTARGGVLGACHSLDIPFVFDVLDLPGLERFTGEDPPQALADQMSAAWTRFARDGDPGSAWPRFNEATRDCLILDAEPRVLRDPDRAKRQFWESGARRPG